MSCDFLRRHTYIVPTRRLLYLFLFPVKHYNYQFAVRFFSFANSAPGDSYVFMYTQTSVRYEMRIRNNPAKCLEHLERYHVQNSYFYLLSVIQIVYFRIYFKTNINIFFYRRTANMVFAEENDGPVVPNPIEMKKSGKKKKHLNILIQLYLSTAPNLYSSSSVFFFF